MLISPEIYPHPYTEEQFMEMCEKFDVLCENESSKKLLIILEKELENCSNNSLLLTKEVCEELSEKMKEYAESSPCADIFYNSIFKELHKTFKHEPLEYVYMFLKRLTLLSNFESP